MRSTTECEHAAARMLSAIGSPLDNCSSTSRLPVRWVELRRWPVHCVLAVSILAHMLQDEPQAESEQRVASEQALQAATTALASALELRDAKPAGQVQELARAALELLDVVFDRGASVTQSFFASIVDRQSVWFAEDEHGAASSHSRGNALSVRGQALALLDGRAAEAEEALTRAVRGSP